MQTTSRLHLHMHDDTVVDLPNGTRYELDRGGVRTIAPDGTERAWPAWEVLHTDAALDAADRPRRTTR
jgi:hypothetical protein